MFFGLYIYNLPGFIATNESGALVPAGPAVGEVVYEQSSTNTKVLSGNDPDKLKQELMCRGKAKSHGVGLAPLRSAKARVVTTTRSDNHERATPAETRECTGEGGGGGGAAKLGLLWWSCW